MTLTCIVLKRCRLGGISTIDEEKKAADKKWIVFVN